MTFQLETFVDDCHRALAEATPQLAIREVLDRALSQPEEVVRALGEPNAAAITPLHHSPELTILNVVWAPRMSIYPHNHQMWALIGLYGGSEDNTFYRRGPAGLSVVSGKQLATKETAALGSTVIHSVSNPLDRFTGAIHIYGGDFFAVSRSEWDPDTLEERPYDIERAKRVFVEANERYRASAR
jgi:predicted metal-dependent enzyme (double-stranded beta helix superfamily)